MNDVPENREPFAVPLNELEAETLAHYENAASALGEWLNTIPQAIREHFARRRADSDIQQEIREALDSLERIYAAADGFNVEEYEDLASGISGDVDLYRIRDTLRALAAERDNYRESMGRLASLAKGLAAERDALRAQLQEAKEALEGEFFYGIDGDHAFMPIESARKIMKAIGDAYCALYRINIPTEVKE